MSRLITFWIAALLVTWMGAVHAAPSADGPVQIADPPLDAPPSPEEVARRTEFISQQLRCPVCQALSVADSSSDAARTMKARIKELVEQGYTEEQVIDYFVDRYGEWVQLAPPPTGLNWLIWLGPVVVVVTGAVLVLRRAREAQVVQTAPDEHSTDASSDDGLAAYRARILAEVRQEFEETKS